MGNLNDVFVTAGISLVQAAQYNKIASSAQRGDMANTETLTGTKTLVDIDFAIQFLDCNGANRIVNLPAPASVNHPFYIYNLTELTYTITVKDSGGTILAIIQPGNVGTFVSDSTQYVAFFSSAPISAGVFGSSPNTAGASISGSNITLQPADTTHPGGISTGIQSIPGLKTMVELLTLGDGAQVIGDSVGWIQTNLNGSGIGDIGFSEVIPGKGTVTGSFYSTAKLTIPSLGFDTVPLSTNWTTLSGTPTQSNAIAPHSGSYCLQLNALNEGVISAAFISTLGPSVLGDLWLYGASGTVTIKLQCFTTAGVSLGYVTSPLVVTVGGSEWKRYLNTMKLLAKTTKVKIIIQLTAAGTVYVDDLSMYAGKGSQMGVVLA